MTYNAIYIYDIKTNYTLYSGVRQPDFLTEII
jgi:hypothetical protein